MIGTLGAVDQDASAGDKFSYTLVSGVGDSDNAAFKISGAELKSEQSFDVAQRDTLRKASVREEQRTKRKVIKRCALLQDTTCVLCS